MEALVSLGRVVESPDYSQGPLGAFGDGKDPVCLGRCITDTRAKREIMRARVLFTGLVALLIVVIGGPASAKAAIAGATITGPGLDGGLMIGGPDSDGLWGSGIDMVGGSDDTRAPSIEELGLTPGDLGPRYLLTYRFHGSDEGIRQDLYPYAKGAPVTRTPAGQELRVGVRMRIAAGWYRSSPRFLEYLVSHGLPRTNPVGPPAIEEQLPADPSSTLPWAGVGFVMGLAVLALAVLGWRREATSSG
jgi:hypothetical protein